MKAVWTLAGINSGDLADIVQQDKIIPGLWRRCTCQIVLLHGVWVDMLRTLMHFKVGTYRSDVLIVEGYQSTSTIH